ncbi:hypothetical protein Y1Q_0022207 [Alligator mississippiensis]|uniref:ribonuclease H n=1 Tax=Alligator mississippiensis TaxID=8496 RepID=A0A151NZN9_ALLMI|nr:hypothetical protein Y1Q_0022207 [Alligator mississippiensis]
MSTEGCYEHNFTLQMALDNAQRTRKQCAVAWLDISNAFGSMPHCHIFSILRELGLPDSVIDLVRELYHSCTTTVCTTDGETAEIPIWSGVSQGCPLSPIVFNLAMEVLFRAVAGSPGRLDLNGQKLSVLAYTDNLVLLAPDATQLQQMLDVTSEAARWMGLRFNVAKCASLHIDGRQKSRVLDSTLTIQGQTMRHLKESFIQYKVGAST